MVKFVEEDNMQYNQYNFKNLVIEELFLYYQSLLETELGLLYLRQISEANK